jgi:hypothetical protein
VIRTSSATEYGVSFLKYVEQMGFFDMIFYTVFFGVISYINTVHCFAVDAGIQSLFSFLFFCQTNDMSFHIFCAKECEKGS